MYTGSSAFRRKKIVWAKRNAGTGKTEIGIGKEDAVCLERIENEHVTCLCGIGLIIDDDVCVSFIDTDDFDTVMMMVFCKYVFRIENIDDGFQNCPMIRLEGLVQTAFVGALAVFIMVLEYGKRHDRKALFFCIWIGIHDDLHMNLLLYLF